MGKQLESNHVAIILGVTGLVGKELATRLVAKPNWKVYGVARRPDTISIKSPNYHFISCDLLDPLDTKKKLAKLNDLSHLFWITWASDFPLDSQECCEQNKAMMCNALNAILPNAPNLKHFSLQTGMKHYVSLQPPFTNEQGMRSYNEECPRSSSKFNFYHYLEDLLQEKLAMSNVNWSVLRPGLLIGNSHRTLYNFLGCLCVYGAICKYMKLPFIFGGSREHWDKISIDGSDVRLVAEQHIWAATNGYGQAFNSINGPSFTWKEIWPAIGRKFGLEVAEAEDMFDDKFLYSSAMADKEKVWEEIVEKEGLVQTKMEDLANWAFLDVLFRCPVKMLGTRNKVDRLGFTMRYETLDSILYWIDRMKIEKLIP